MDILALGILFLAGGAAGFIAGFFGVGGGILLVPILLLHFQSLGVAGDVLTHLALGTSLCVVTFTSLSSGIRHARQGNVVWRAVVLLAPASIVGAWCGSLAAAMMPGASLQRIFAVVVLLAGVQMVRRPPRGDNDDTPAIRPAGILVFGVLVGAISSLAGIGGGLISIPVLVRVFRFPVKRAIGSSSATIVATALAGTIGYMVQGAGNVLLPDHTAGFVAYPDAIPVIVASVPMAHIGARVAHSTPPSRLRIVFALFLFLVAGRLLLF